MTDKIISKSEIDINAAPAKVWQALTDPAYIKEYLYGTEAKSDWQVGSPITFTGEWEGQKYEDKGKIIRIEREKVLEYSYFSSMSGKEDKPENYGVVTYKLTSDGKKTHLEISSTSDSEAGAEQSASNWQQALEQIKEKLEK